MYSFQFVRLVGKSPSSLQIAYPSHEEVDDHLEDGLVQLIEDYNRRISPSRLLFVCPLGMETLIQGCFDDQRARFEDRLVSTSHITVAPYDHKGWLASDNIIHLKQDDETWDITDEFLSSAAQEGISALFDETKTILHAPHGYAFQKLSGREANMFVRAGNMLREPGSMSIFNHLLLRKLPSNSRFVYIDSFTILSFALGLQSIVRYFRHSGRSLPALAIENTHSYEINPDFRIPNEDNYVILISASTSGGLARKLVDKHQADPSRIIHLLGVGPHDANFSKSCIYFRSHGNNTEHPISANHSNTPIEIGTEEFLVAQGPPRPVRITTKHVNDDAATEFHKSFYGRALQFGEGSAPEHRRYSPFSISNQIELAVSSPIQDWVRDHLVHELPASVRALVHVDNEMSKQVANWIGTSLGPHVVIKSLEEVEAEKPEQDSAKGSLIVIAHHDPGLESLTRASIAFRKLGDIHRHYVVCFGFPSSRVEHDRLRADLLMAPGRRKYGWSEFVILPVGVSLLHESLISHRSYCSAEALETHRKVLGENFANALANWSAYGSIANDGLFFPRTAGTALALRHGSVFFPHRGEEDVSQISVYAMVSAAIQHAREPIRYGKTDMSPEFRFDNNPFVRSILDPSMFTRFSDGILQASLLRASHPSELDYSGSDDFSRQFTSDAVSVLTNHENAVGDAAVEYVYALATNKISLRHHDHGFIRNKIDSIPVLHACWHLFRAKHDDLTGEHPLI